MECGDPLPKVPIVLLVSGAPSTGYYMVVFSQPSVISLQSQPDSNELVRVSEAQARLVGSENGGQTACTGLMQALG